MGIFSSSALGGTPKLRSWVKSKVTVLSGDMALPLLGLSKEAYSELQQSVNIIIHLAALPHFYAPVDDIVNTNTLGAVRMGELAAGCVNLQLHLHYSTTYCNGDGGPDCVKMESPFAWGCSPAAQAGNSAAFFDVDQEVASALAAPDRLQAAAAAAGKPLHAASLKKQLKVGRPQE